MTKTAIRKGRSAATAHGLKAGDEPGTFEAIVSVFGNVDFQNDRINPGAFAGSLERWKASGDPIPVIWSHQWDDLDAHVGAVVDAKELLPGDASLPPELAEFGGLWTKFSIDAGDGPEDAAARKVATLLSERRVKEFSFAYDVLDEHRGNDGVNELDELDVLEVGPTLKGANPATRLLSAALDAGLDGQSVAAFLKAVEDGAAPEPDPAGEKARIPVEFDGSIETVRDSVWGAAHEWAQTIETNGGLYATHLEATFPDDDGAGKAIVLVEGWDDPIGEGVFYELAYSTDEESGEVVIDEAAEIEFTVELSLKARPLERRARGKSLTPAEAAGRVKSAKDNGEDPETGNPEDSEQTGPALSPVDLVEIELLGLDV